MVMDKGLGIKERKRAAGGYLTGFCATHIYEKPNFRSFTQLIGYILLSIACIELVKKEKDNA
jgi:hypothetical protein